MEKKIIISMPRLNQVTKELNIGFSTAANFLKKRFGVIVSPNEKISDEQYVALSEEFYRDKVAHNVAMKITPPRKNKTKAEPFTEEELDFLEADKANPKSFHELGLKSAADLKIRKEKLKEKTRRQCRDKRGGMFPNMGKYARIVSVPFGGMNKK